MMGEKHHLEHLNINQLVSYSISVAEIRCLTMQSLRMLLYWIAVDVGVS